MENHILSLARLSTLSAIGLLAGCIPAPMGNYYKPIYSDTSAKYHGDECHGQAGAPATLSWSIADGVSLTITTVRTYGEKNRQDRPLRIGIELPLGTQFQFLSSDLRVSKSLQELGESIGPHLHISASVLIGSKETVDLAKIAPTPFQTNDQILQIKDFSASTWLNFSWRDSFVPTAFTMKIPPVLLVDTPKSDQRPIIVEATAKKRLDRYPGEYKSQTSLIYTTKGSEAELADKYAKCLNETPTVKCENILIYDEAGYKVIKDDFTFAGRWYVFDVEKKTPFSGELKVTYKTPIRWRFATDTVWVTDAANHTERSYKFDNFPLHISYQVPMNTPIHGVNNVAYSKATSASINTSLGVDESPRYFVKLPPVLINGTRYEIKPIELERRIFDFGLEPFNC